MLRSKFQVSDGTGGDAYRSDEVDARGWAELQGRVPQLAGIDAYQAVFVAAALSGIEELTVPNVADPFHVASLQALVDGLQEFASKAKLPVDEVGLMKLSVKYLEDDSLIDRDLDVQTYVQLMLSARQAVARGQALWIVV